MLNVLLVQGESCSSLVRLFDRILFLSCVGKGIHLSSGPACKCGVSDDV